MKKREKGREDGGGLWFNAVCEVLKGGVLAGVVTILALLLCSVLVSMGVIPVEAMEGTVLAVCVLGTLVGGIYAGRRAGAARAAGRGGGAVLFLLLLTAGLLAYEGASVANGGVSVLCACLCGGAIPGILGRKPKKKRRR